MGRREKLLDKWESNTPTDAPVSEVIGVLDYYFKGKWEMAGGSHIRVVDSRLDGYYGYSAGGLFQIPTKHGQRVKGEYLEKLARAVALIRQMEEQ